MLKYILVILSILYCIINVNASALNEQTSASQAARFRFPTVADPNNNVILYSCGEAASYVVGDVMSYDPTNGYRTISTGSAFLPSIRNGAISTILPDSSIYILGMGAYGYALNDMWALNLTSLVWTQVDPISCRSTGTSVSSTCPSIRTSASSVLIPTGPFANKLFVHGGYYYMSETNNMVHSDAWLFDVYLYTWTKVDYVGGDAGSHAFHAIGFYNNKVYIFGGNLNNASAAGNTLFAFDTSTSVWSPITLTGTVMPSSVSLFTTGAVYSHYFLMCGYGNGDLYSIDLDSNIMSIRATSLYGGQSEAAMAILNNRVYLMGGSGVSIFPVSTFNLLDPSNSYTFFPNDPATTVGFRSSHILALCSGKMLVYGGLSSAASNDGYDFDIKTGVWQKSIFTSARPSLIKSAFLSYNSSIYIQGGLDETTTNVSQLWKVTASPSTINDPNKNFTYVWTDLSSSVTGAALPTKQDHTAVLITSPLTSSSINSYMVTFGGSAPGYSYTFDVYSYNLHTLANTKLSNAPYLVYLHCSVSFGQKMISYGGSAFGETLSNIYYTTFTFDNAGNLLDGTWNVPTIVSTVNPGKRYASSCAPYNNKYMLLFGGVDQGIAYNNELWSLNTETNYWQLLTIGNTNPSARAYARMLLIDSRIFIHAGVKAGITTSDLFLISPLSDVSVNPSNGSDYQCILSPSSNCYSLTKAISSFSASNGLTQNFMLSTLSSYSVSDIAITTAISIASIVGQTGYITMSCQGRCFTISAASGTTYLANVYLNGLSSSSITADGGLLKISKATVIISNCRFFSSKSAYGGAIYMADGATVTITASNFTNLNASSAGGAFYSQSSTLSISDSIFENNIINPSFGYGVSNGISNANSIGGAIAALSTTFSLTNCYFSSNIAVGATSNTVNSYGGAVYLFSSICTIYSSTFTSNSADYGGGFYSRGTTDITNGGFSYIGGVTTVSITISNFKNNYAYISGGGLYMLYIGSITMVGGTISGNTALTNGGGVWLTGTAATMTSVSITSNIGKLGGGGIFNSLAQLQLSSVSLISNTAFNGGGGGIFWYRTTLSQAAYIPIFTSCTINTNSAWYGNDFATSAIALTIQNYITFYTIYSGTTPSSPYIIVAITDYYGSVVTTDSASTVSAVPSNIWAGSSVLKLVNGTATFSAIILSAQPNTTTSSYFTTSGQSFGDGVFDTQAFDMNARICNPGEYVLNKVCYACGSGTYSNASMSTSCLSCPAGSNSNGVGLSACSTCNAGYYTTSSGQQYCTACNYGYYNSFNESLSCDFCVAGKYASSTGSSTCTDCPIGYYGKDSASAACVQCGRGTFSSITGSSVCTLCLAGTASSASGATNCTTCSIGTVSVAGSATCSNCPTGTYANSTGMSACILCPAGTASSSTAAGRCAICGAGYYSVENSLSCSRCSYGTFSNATSLSACYSCPIGSYQSSVGTSYCDLCIPGSFQDAVGKGYCVTCNSGKYSNVSGATECDYCTAGKYSPTSGSSSCLDCDLGSYANAVGQVSCKSCSTGKYASETSLTACINCGTGTSAGDTGSSTCTNCTAGTFSVEGSKLCLSCSYGKYSTSDGSTTCTSCSFGSAQSESGTTACNLCTPGSYASSSGLYSCSPCVVGKYSNISGATFCSECAGGTYNGDAYASVCLECAVGFYSVLGAVNCLSCSSGTYSNTNATSTCIPCSAGTYAFNNPQNGTTACTSCEPGTSFPSTGASSCINCVDTLYQPLSGQLSCLACPDSARSSPDSSRTSCSCNINTFNKNGTCTDCPSGGDCSTAGVVSTNINPLSGYYLSETNPPYFQSCFRSQSCSGDRNFQCVSPYTGNLCATCIEGYQLNNKYECIACPNSNANNGRLLGIAIAFIVIGVTYAHYTTKDSKNTIPGQVLKVVIAMIQFNSLAIQFQFNWPYPLSSFLQLQLDSSYVGSSFLSVECSQQSSSTLSPVYINSALFLFLPLMIVIFIHIFYFVKKIITGDDSAHSMAQAPAASFVLLLFIHPSITQQTFKLFNCYQIGTSTSNMYLTADMSQKCWSSEHITWVLLCGLPLLIFCVFGIPLAAFMLLYSNSEQLHSERMAPFKFLINAYEPKYWYWNFLVITRQILMVAIAVFLTGNTQSQALVAILLCVVVLVIHSYARPFVLDEIDLIEFVSVLTSFCTFFFGIFLFVQQGTIWSSVFTVFIFFLNISFLLFAPVLVFQAFMGKKISGGEEDLMKSDIRSPNMQVPMNFSPNPLYGSPGSRNINQLHLPQEQYTYPPIQGINIPLHQVDNDNTHHGRKLSQINLTGENNSNVELVKF